MKTSKFFILTLIVFHALLVSSCSVVGGIFKTGMGVGIFIAMAIVALIVVLILRSRK